MSADSLIHSQFGPWRLLERVGAGGVAEVFRAEHHEDRSMVAIKVMRAEWASDKEKLVSFAQEVELLGELDHPSLPKLRRSGELRGRACCAMDLIQGKPLHAVVADNKPIDVVGALLAAISVTAYLHRNKVVHNDLKLENMLLQRSGRLSLVDFGNARRRRNGTGKFFRKLFKPKPAAVFGTASYLAPELLRGEQPTYQSDVYALGVCAHMLFTGEPPFNDPRRTNRLKQAVKQQAPSLRDRISQLPNSFIDTLDRCLAKDPGDRPEDAASLRHHLKAHFGSGGYPTPAELSREINRQR